MANKILKRLIDRLEKKRYEEGGYMQKMSSYQEGGATPLPGGEMEPIPGTDAVQFNGASHDDGGIMLDPQTEVEGGETMDKVTMKKGGKRDYFFSQHLKKGGKSFSEHHKDILQNGGAQEDIDYLARMQEVAAGRNPENVARDGGVRKYQGGSFKDSNFNNIPDDQEGLTQRTDYTDPQAADQNKPSKEEIDQKAELENKKNNGSITSDEQKELNKINERFKAYGPEYETVEGAYEAAGYTGRGGEGTFRAADLGDEGIAATQSGTGEGYYGEVTSENKEDFYNRNKALLNEMGINSADEFNPEEHTGEFQEKYNASLADRWDNDEAFRKEMESQGMTKDSYISNAGFSGEGAKGLDAKFGEYTWSRTGVESGTPPEEGGDDEVPEEEEDDKTPLVKKKKDFDLSALTDGIPAAIAMMDKPDYMAEPDKITPGIVVPERIAKTHLDRVDYNDVMARNTAAGAATNKFIQSQAAGPAAMANLMNAQTKTMQANLQTKAEENRANTDIKNREASIDAQRKAQNASNVLNASTTNARNIMSAANINAKNKMYVDEFNRAADSATFDRKLQAIDTLAQNFRTRQKDKMMLKASDRMARAISGRTGAYEAEDYSNTLIDQGFTFNSPEYLKEMENFNKNYRIKPTSSETKTETKPEENTEEKKEEKRHGGYYGKMRMYGN